ncbi:D-xylose 1-dehydrogenase Gfo6 [Halobaculum magnesiiphilum]|uniref:Gfo/Idh/MocA family oxidoreductase n=1 Tax=Halobaculum magnesiiphilum TaxID=1017351 RepID=A0A8T8WFM0_9EURY|nr:D-xylose 1-dehydrogenase Gfo6 [Halobaculum magnesiiphilum]QZP38657.1 Gfo/Idh/MocA family oxidoreductase [Halobaculum magnesiiphilum]
MFESTFADAGRRDWVDSGGDEGGNGDGSGSDGDDTTTRIATVGCGNYARSVSIPAMARGDYARPTVVVSGDADKRAALADEFGVTALDYDEYEAGAATDEYDAVYVATPNRLHLPHVETAAGHGKHVICEKPLEATVERAERLVGACEDAGVRLMTAYRMQTDPVMRRLRAFVAAGGIGDLQRAVGDFTFPVLAGDAGPEQWRLDGRLAGGGALYDVGVYPLNTARFVAGDDPTAVSATVRSPDDAFDEVDQHVDFRVEFGGGDADGWVGNFSASFSGHPNTSLELLGTEGRIAVRSAFQPGADREVTVETAEGTMEFAGLGADETVEEFDYFAHAVATGGDIEPDGADGLVDMRTLAAVQASARAGERIELER